MEKIKINFLDILKNRYFLFTVVLLVYLKILYAMGGIESSSSQLQLEFPFVILFYFAFYHLLRQVRYRAVIAAIPIFLIYLIFDIYFIMMGNVFKLVAASELWELIDVLSYVQFAALIVVAGLPLAWFLFSIDYKNNKTYLVMLPIIAFVLLIQFFPVQFLGVFDNISKGVTVWSDMRSVKKNGRLTMLAYFEARRKSNVELAKSYVDEAGYEKVKREFKNYLGDHGNERNIHLIALESFFDPTLTQKASFSIPPHHPKYVKYFGADIGEAIVPVFGGATPQAEFEALCGVPAFGKLSSIEFNVFGGAETNCLPNLLRASGYFTFASHAYKPFFFNRTNAYKGLGFEEMYFPKEYALKRNTYLSIGDVTDEKFMFDKELFSQNLEYVRSLLNGKNRKPFLNYIMSMYGHFPNYIDTDKRPLVVDVNASKIDQRFINAVNQYYYRTEAIVDYVNKLSELDPDSIIIMFGDHLPPLSDGSGFYKTHGYAGGDIYKTRLLVIVNGQPIKLDTLYLFELRELILNYLTNGKFCAESSCEMIERKKSKKDYYNKYMTIMAHATDSGDESF